MFPFLLPNNKEFNINKKIQGKSCVIVISIRLEREPKRHDRLRAWWRGFRCQPGRNRERNNNKSRRRNWKRVRIHRRKGTSQVPIVTQSSVIRYTASLFVYIRNIKNKSRRKKKDARVYISKAAGSAAELPQKRSGVHLALKSGRQRLSTVAHIHLVNVCLLVDWLQTRATSTAQIMIASQSLFFYLYFCCCSLSCGRFFPLM